MSAPTASDRARYCRFVHTETAPAKPMHNKGSKETNSEGFSAHPEPSRRSAAHVRQHPASSGRLCEVWSESLPGSVFRLALRQTEGLIGSIIRLLGLDLSVPDHTTLSRRAETLEVPRPRPGNNTEPVHLLVD